MIKSSTNGRLLWKACALLCFVSTGVAGQRGLPAQNGIANFGMVDEGLYRGAQPDTAAIESLKRLGVKSIINLRMPSHISEDESSQAQAGGIIYTNVPMGGYGRPAETLVRHVLSLIETLPAPVFIHCQRGCDRTGTIVACYRIEHDKWLTKSALEEARTYGMSKWEWGMRRCVIEFGRPPIAPKVAHAANAKAGSS